MRAKKKRIASVQDPAIAAIADGFYRFERESQANALLERLAKQCVISKDQQPSSLKLWIRGFAVTDDEKAQGYWGHFARLAVARLEGGKVSLVAEKLDVPLKLHPQKGRVRQRHPNWGHPILRSAVRGKLYPSAEHARGELLKLHEEFPEATIPGRDRLYVMVYTRMATPPISKCTVNIAAFGDGFRLAIAENTKKINGQGAAEAAPEPAAGGKFTTMVALRRKKRPKPRAEA